MVEVLVINIFQNSSEKFFFSSLKITQFLVVAHALLDKRNARLAQLVADCGANIYKSD